MILNKIKLELHIKRDKHMGSRIYIIAIQCIWNHSGRVAYLIHYYGSSQVEQPKDRLSALI